MKPQPLLPLRPPHEHYQKQSLDLPRTDTRREEDMAMIEFLAILATLLLLTVLIFVGYWVMTL